MTGIIKSLESGGASGTITTEDGLVVRFPLSAVPVYDLPVLTIGQVVNFDLERGRFPKALNVYVLQSQGVNTRQEHTRLRYLGFEHRGNIRVYLFEGLIPGVTKRTIAVEADVALFTRHHVGIQEGPALCLHLLVEKLDAEDAAAQTSFNCSLSDREMLAYLESRPDPHAKHLKRARRTTV